jgi:hypothetical protein
LSWFGNPSNSTALETNPEIRKSTSRRVADIRVLLRKKVHRWATHDTRGFLAAKPLLRGQ